MSLENYSDEDLFKELYRRKRTRQPETNLQDENPELNRLIAQLKRDNPKIETEIQQSETNIDNPLASYEQAGGGEAGMRAFDRTKRRLVRKE